MTDDLIRKLANEYAEEMIRRILQTVRTPPDILLDVASSEAKFNMEDVIRFIIRRYALVEKSRVKDEYIKAIEEGKHTHPKHQIQSRTRIRLIESLFPEIGKEVE